MSPLIERIIAAHAAVTDVVGHGTKMKADRYFVWQEDGASDLLADGRRAERCITGTTDLFTRREFDPWKERFEESLEASGICWELISVQYEQQTGYWHWEWAWEVF